MTKNIKQANTLEFNNAKKIDSFLFLQTLMIVNLVIMGVTLSNIIHFIIEDVYKQPLVKSIFFGTEYAVSGAWFIITTFVFQGFSIWEWSRFKKNSILIKDTRRLFVLQIALYASSIIAFFYIISIIYGFLSGKTDYYGLIRILVTLVILAIGMIYVSMQMYCSRFIQTRAYIFSINLTCLASVIGIISLIMIFASPLLQRKINKDITRANSLIHISKKIQHYFNNYGHLPQTLDNLLMLGLLKNDHLADSEKKPYTYKIITDRSFDLCTHFETDSDMARRISPFSNYDYKQGDQCQRYFMEKNRNGYYDLQFHLHTRES
jgi:hypothetical protein